LDLKSAIRSALDEVSYGIVLLNEDLQALFINRAYYDMWNLPPAPSGKPYSFTELRAHGRKLGVWPLPETKIDEYVEQRIAFIRDGTRPPVEVRLKDGRVIKLACHILPGGGGRMLTYADVSELVLGADRLRSLASMDDLTNLMNRRQFMTSFEDEFRRALRYKRPLSVIMIDPDDFKSINDRHGHAVGDEVLRSLAARFRATVRNSDLLGRVGGEEFAAALPETDLPNALDAAERLRREVAEQPFEVRNATLRVTVSLGVAAKRPHDTDPGELLRFADRALYAAKAAGRNCVSADSPSALGRSWVKGDAGEGLRVGPPHLASPPRGRGT
jgi:diguanylate cyclase (GGDEF)-like protein